MNGFSDRKIVIYIETIFTLRWKYILIRKKTERKNYDLYYSWIQPGITLISYAITNLKSLLSTHIHTHTHTHTQRLHTGARIRRRTILITFSRNTTLTQNHMCSTDTFWHPSSTTQHVPLICTRVIIPKQVCQQKYERACTHNTQTMRAHPSVHIHLVPREITQYTWTCARVYTSKPW